MKLVNKEDIFNDYKTTMEVAFSGQKAMSVCRKGDNDQNRYQNTTSKLKSHFLGLGGQFSQNITPYVSLSRYHHH